MEVYDAHTIVHERTLKLPCYVLLSQLEHIPSLTRRMPPMFIVEVSNLATKASVNIRERLRLTLEEFWPSEVRIAHYDMDVRRFLDKGVNVSYGSRTITMIDT
jgi:hypothetical protein